MVTKKIKTQKTQAQFKKAIQKNGIGKIKNAKSNVVTRLQRINRVIGRFEGEVESLLKKIVKQGNRSRRELRKNFDDILARVRSGGLLAKANETRGELEREIRRLAEEAIDTVKEVEALINSDKVSDLFQNARKGLVNVVELLTDNGFVYHAKQKVLQTRQEVLSLLRIPTQGDVDKLERKLSSLEKRLSSISRKAA
jgi:polyhydroxyalkanoate synthesis regulator phasin